MMCTVICSVLSITLCCHISVPLGFAQTGGGTGGFNAGYGGGVPIQPTSGPPPAYAPLPARTAPAPPGQTPAAPPYEAAPIIGHAPSRQRQVSLMDSYKIRTTSETVLCEVLRRCAIYFVHCLVQVISS